MRGGRKGRTRTKLEPDGLALSHELLAGLGHGWRRALGDALLSRRAMMQLHLLRMHLHWGRWVGLVMVGHCRLGWWYRNRTKRRGLTTKYRRNRVSR